MHVGYMIFVPLLLLSSVISHINAIILVIFGILGMSECMHTVLINL